MIYLATSEINLGFVIPAVKGLLKKQKSDAEQEQDSEEKRATTASSENIQHPTTSLAAIMRSSYDEQHRFTMCLLGAIHALADLTVVRSC